MKSRADRRAWTAHVAGPCIHGRDPKTETKVPEPDHPRRTGGRPSPSQAQAHLNKMLGKRDRGRNLDSSRQTLKQFLDRWMEVLRLRIWYGKP
jgi:hypothetical protein